MRVELSWKCNNFLVVSFVQNRTGIDSIIHSRLCIHPCPLLSKLSPQGCWGCPMWFKWFKLENHTKLVEEASLHPLFQPMHMSISFNHWQWFDVFLTYSSRCPSNSLSREDLVELVDLSKRWGVGAGAQTSFLGWNYAQEFIGLVMCKYDPCKFDHPRKCSEVVYPKLVEE